MELQEFHKLAGGALSGCQAVEDALKIYLGIAFEVVKKRVAGELNGDFGADLYETEPLHRLIGIFKSISGDKVLTESLQGFKKRRNRFVHHAIVASLDYDGELDEKVSRKNAAEFRCLNRDAEKLVSQITDKQVALLVILHFEHVKEQKARRRKTR